MWKALPASLRSAAVCRPMTLPEDRRCPPEGRVGRLRQPYWGGPLPGRSGEPLGE